MRKFLKSLAIQLRVVGALIMRETYSRFGRENLGFAWMFGEFLIFALPVIGMWRIIRGHYEHGLSVVPFVWTGYFPILLFRHIGSRMIFAVRGNVALLYHRNVTPFDSVLARMALEIMGNYMATVFAFFLFYCVGAMDWPRNMPMLFLGYFFMTWWCVCPRLHHCRIQRAHRNIRKGVAAGFVYVLARVGLFLHGCLAAAIDTAPIAECDAGAAML